MINNENTVIYKDFKDASWLQSLLSSDYQTTLTELDKLIEENPDSAELYWARLLTLNNTNNAQALINKGFDLADPNLKYALHYADSQQLDFLNSVINSSETLQKQLKRELENRYINQQKSLNLIQQYNQFNNYYEQQYKQLQSYYQELEDIEKDLKNNHFDLIKQMDQSESIVNLSLKELDQIKQSLGNNDLITYENKTNFSHRINGLIKVGSKEAEDAAYNRSHGYGNKFDELLQQRNRIVNQIENLIEEINLKKQEVDAVAQEYQNNSMNFKSLINQIDKGDYSNISTLTS